MDSYKASTRQRCARYGALNKSNLEKYTLKYNVIWKIHRDHMGCRDYGCVRFHRSVLKVRAVTIVDRLPVFLWKLSIFFISVYLMRSKFNVQDVYCAFYRRSKAYW
eukprot:NODE_711_length_4934_cov_0.531954.p4 type:complete len:106 gc:universal NODE_711_length_4934_cov_0.531954:1568-1885(+)